MSEGDFGLVEGSGNVFRDFGDPDADLKQAKAVLAARIIAVLDDHGLTVRKATGLSRFAAADFSRICNVGLGRFTLDGLVRMLGALDTGLQVTVRPAACRRGGHDEPRLSSGLSMLEKAFPLCDAKPGKFDAYATFGKIIHEAETIGPRGSTVRTRNTEGR